MNSETKLLIKKIKKLIRKAKATNQKGAQSLFEQRLLILRRDGTWTEKEVSTQK
jgi:hypothetical protein